MAKKLSKAVLTKITTAIYGAASSTNRWAQASAEHRQGQDERGSFIKYMYRDYKLDLVQTAEVMSGYTIRVNERKTFLTPVNELLKIMSTSVMHNQQIKTNMFSSEVKNIEAQMVAHLRTVADYVNVYLGEFEDVVYGCPRRELIVRIKPEFYDQIPLTMRHVFLDNALKETLQSRKVRNERAVFGQ